MLPAKVLDNEAIPREGRVRTANGARSTVDDDQEKHEHSLE